MGKKNDGAIFLELPETEEWKKLGLPKELGNNLKMVYQRKEKDKPAEFLEVWNPDKEYPSSCIITNVSSTLGGFKLMQAGTEIVNMQGTSKDPKHGYNSWIDFMRAAYQKIGLENGLVGGCSVDNYIYERDENGDEIAIPCAHSVYPAGAHVYEMVGGQIDPNNFYLVSLCSRHNKAGTIRTYMKLEQAVLAIKLDIMQALIKVDFELLGTKLVAEYYKSNDKEYYLLMPTDQADARGITINDMINDICYLIGLDDTAKLQVKELTDCIESLGLSFKDIKVVLKMAYFYSVVDSTNSTGENAAPVNNTEYAFQLEIDTSKALPESLKIFNIQRVGVAVWNTERSKIISQMNLYKPEDLLKEI